LAFIILDLLKIVENYDLVLRYNSPINIRQVKEFFKDKNNTPCPLTDRLVKAGYQ